MTIARPSGEMATEVPQHRPPSRVSTTENRAMRASGAGAVPRPSANAAAMPATPAAALINSPRDSITRGAGAAAVSARVELGVT